MSGEPEQPGERAFGAPGQYDDRGVDLSLIRSNLSLTPTERARRAERARRSALRVQRLREQEGLR